MLISRDPTVSGRKTRILLVDDDVQALESTRKILDLAGYETEIAADGQAALEQVRPGVDGARARGVAFDLILTDVRMPRLGGLEFLRALSLCGESTPVILMTAFGRIEDAVWAMKLGAVDFLTKPFKRQALLSSIEAALKRARAQAAELPDPVLAEDGAAGAHPHRAERATDTGSLARLVGRSRPMLELRGVIEQVAPTAATVLLTGESGTGKELVARCVHERSPRVDQPFIALNCAAFPENLIESELFGFEKGAFTGANSARAGLFEAANGGTLLLDEIGDMPLSLQAKLLRTLQESEVRRVGATQSRKIDVRVIAATHRDLRELVRLGTFREDLLYRLEVIHVHVAPLRDRVEDIPDLAYHFLRTASARHAKTASGITEEAMEILLAHPWPGNIRELSNVIERAVVFLRGPHVTPAELPAHLAALVARDSATAPAGATAGPRFPARPGSEKSISVPLGTSLRDVEELLIRKTLEATSGDKNMTAKLLGINSRTIYRKLAESTEDESR